MINANDWLNLVWKSHLPPRTKGVCHALADDRAEIGQVSSVSMEALMLRLAMRERTIRTHLAIAETLGLVKVGISGGDIQYHLRMPEGGIDA